MCSRFSEDSVTGAERDKEQGVTEWPERERGSDFPEFCGPPECICTPEIPPWKYRHR